MKTPVRSMRRLWGIIHVRPLAVVIGIIETVFIVIQALIVFCLSSYTHSTATVIHIIAVLLAIASVSLLLVGIFYRLPLLLRPHLVIQVIMSVVLLLLALGSFICLLFGTSIHVRVTLVRPSFPITSETVSLGDNLSYSLVSNVFAGILLGTAIISLFIWSFSVVLDCYHFLSTYEAKKATVMELVRSDGVTMDNMRLYRVEGGGEADNDQYSMIGLRKAITPT